MDFCAKCGIKGKTKEGLCDKCNSEENPSMISFKDVKLSICKNCKKTLIKYQWIRFNSLTDAIKRVVLENVKGTKKVIVNPIIEEKQQSEKVKGEVHVIVPGIEEEYVIPYELNYVLCPNCAKMKREYFEGVLQLREVNQEVINFCLNDIAKHKHKGGIFFSKTEDVTNGIDMYCSSNKYLINLGKKLKKRFKGEQKTTARLFSKNKQTSKDVYRVTVLFRQEKKEEQTNSE